MGQNAKNSLGANLVGYATIADLKETRRYQVVGVSERRWRAGKQFYVSLDSPIA